MRVHMWCIQLTYQYGVLVYGTTKKTVSRILQINEKLNMKIIFQTFETLNDIVKK